MPPPPLPNARSPTPTETSDAIIFSCFGVAIGVVVACWGARLWWKRRCRRLQEGRRQRKVGGGGNVDRTNRERGSARIYDRRGGITQYRISRIEVASTAPVERELRRLEREEREERERGRGGSREEEDEEEGEEGSADGDAGGGSGSSTTMLRDIGEAVSTAFLASTSVSQEGGHQTITSEQSEMENSLGEQGEDSSRVQTATTPWKSSEAIPCSTPSPTSPPTPTPTPTPTNDR